MTGPGLREAAPRGLERGGRKTINNSARCSAEAWRAAPARVPPWAMLLREEDVEMRAENSSSLLPRSPLRLDRMPDQTRRSSWEGPGTGRSSSHGAAPSLAVRDANNGQRAPALPRSARRRRDLLIEDMKDLLGRAVVYALALLGLLHVLGLVAAA